MSRIVLITGTRKGIGRYLVDHYVAMGDCVIGCSRNNVDYYYDNYQHFCVDVSSEKDVKSMMSSIRKKHGRLDVLINNAGIASMNHFLLTPSSTVSRILDTNVLGTFLLCREASKLMKKNNKGRIVNFTSVAAPLKIEGESIYASSKAAVNSLTQILAYELGEIGITVNAVGPTPIKTDLIKSVPGDKIEKLLNRQAIKRFGRLEDISNVVDFLISPKSDFITGQIIYLGGV